MTRLLVHADCRHYRGDLPCRIGKLCWTCDAPEPVRIRRLFVASRPVPLPDAKAPDEEWTVLSPARHDDPRVDRFLPEGWESRLRLSVERFQERVSLDGTPVPGEAALDPPAAILPESPRRILIVKRGAMGDALRTTPLLRAHKANGPCEITWIADADSCEVLSRARHLDRLLPFDEASAAALCRESFHRVESLDKDPAACALSMLVPARERTGFALAPSGRVVARDARCDETLRLGLDDDFKFRANEKTVPQLTLEVSGFPFRGEPYDFAPRDDEAAAAERIAAGLPRPFAALNVGAGPRWPTKAWPEPCWAELGRILAARGLAPVLVGGSAERPAIERLSRAEPALSDGGGPYSVGVFAALLSRAACVVTGDTLALHLALAAGVPVVALFCSTTPREICFYGRGEALASPEGPCYKADCPRYPACFAKVTPEAVAEAVLRWASAR